jgi:hypothetical protein
MPTIHTDIDCPICGRRAPELAHGLVAPFVSTLSNLSLGQPTTLRTCTFCDLEFFDARYGDDELSSLYGGYRGNEYRETRHHWEPWYSRNVNDACSTDADLLVDRRRFMAGILDAAQMKPTLECAVDFGGDEGQFFPSIPTARRIVCDLSDRPLPTGVEHMSTLSELGDVRADLIIIAHVLEHLPDPIKPLREIRAAIADDGIVYVEVPLDRFRVSRFHGSVRYQRYIQKLIRHRISFVVLDFLTGLSRQFRVAIPRLGVIKQSEHINYFSGRSLEAALNASGFTIVAQGSDEQLKIGGLRIGCYGVAAKPVK